jgi:NAD(P)-dependent dehydrogenase (short-subunit alcohol dehydrogenase family)
MGVLVTGGGSGIGLGISRRLLEEGAAVTIVGRSAQRLEEGRQALVAAGADPASVRAHAADMSREDPAGGRLKRPASFGRAARRRRVRGRAQGADGAGYPA